MPEANRFHKVILDEGLNEPIELVILPNDNVLLVERHGAIKIYDQQEKATIVLNSIATGRTTQTCSG
jgi:cytochrome c